MEITSLNDEFFGKCTLKEKLGLISNNKGEIIFKPKDGSAPITITDDKQLKRWDDSKFNRKKLKDGITIIGKLQVNEQVTYLLCNHDNLSYNGKPITKGSVVIKCNNSFILFNNLPLFLAEVKDRKKADLKQAVQIYKQNEAKGKISQNTSNFAVNDMPENVIELSARDSYRYVLLSYLVKISDEGGVYHWGWRLRDTSGNTVELDDKQVKELASHGQIKDTTLDSDDNLKGENYDINSLDQDYAS